MPDKGFYSLFKDNQEKRLLCARIFSLLKKLLAGEEANAPLFGLVDSFLEFLQINEFSDEEIRNAETVLILRVLHLLGYIPKNEVSRNFAQNMEWNMEIVTAMAPYRKDAVKMINESLRATGL